MRIGIDIRPLMEERLSGVAQYTMQLTRKLLTLDTSNEYILFYSGFKKSWFIHRALTNTRAKIIPVLVPNKLFNGAQTFLHFPFIDKKLSGLDIFFAPNWGFVNISPNCRLVVTAHDLAYKIYPQFLSPKGRIWHRVIHPEKFFTQADHIVAVSQHTKNDVMSTFKIPENRISVVYSGVDHANIRELDNKFVLQEKYKLPTDYILSVGNIEPRKNISGLIGAFLKLKGDERVQKKYPGLKLLIAGARGWQSETLPKNQNDIIFLGYIPEEEKAALYRQALIFCYPSFYEGFGFPPLEAGLEGTASVVSAVSALPEVMGDSAVLVDPYNMRDITYGIMTLLLDDDFRREKGQAAQKRAQEFRWEKTARQMIRLWESVIRSHA
ncbi:MAG: hypothetical protein A3F54_04710 [Candidatus Kerfeldbacteria bacterium RIFCSPHIGHO2_12_FULL_48_17]|uniref:Glycosyl transferase family 1 domain-containing protein n=1 Tax=Candidatus Kerfeldbacteria bacterium RIFCSPHIGHO2_12_FULL_48_17 TaxID=1798542 RepID=A0A1G2AY38_9BACT|nr:MAG: hypothetical protein A3F54_04710 [Candidatus Kerfeldbacteria bacterium RIFCSPHIGHO2_12_FULL_48_17]